ncbi:MAG: hypothetical protein KC766_30250 [Myxococcales bacterium]|nr:hypothetical protein [Myxococcales bacterium]
MIERGPGGYHKLERLSHREADFMLSTMIQHACFVTKQRPLAVSVTDYGN